MDTPVTPEVAPPADASLPTPSKARGSRGSASPRTQLTPKDWIDAGTEVLVDKSIDAVTVDSLSKALGVTRGSFYWHFTDRGDLLARLLQTWRDAATEQVISRFEREGVSARELIGELLALPFRGRAASRASSIELAIRGWARRDDMARKAVDEVDAQRLSYIAQCFSALGFDIAEARSRAFMLYGYELAEALLSGQGTEQQRTDRRFYVEQMLLSPARGH